MHKLSYIILNYNVTDLLRKCLQSVITYTKNIDYEVIVIDNASPDPSWKVLQQEFPGVKFMAENENLGFAVANNKAALAANGEFLFILNPDTEILGDYMSTVVSFAESKSNFGCLGLRMQDAAGKFLPESKRSVPNMFNSFEKLFTGFRRNSTKSYYRDDIGECEIAEVEVLTGANLLIRKEVYLEAGGFDERYFMYGEDIDLCYTLLQKGCTNWYMGKYSILHHKGESTVKDRKYLEHFYGAMKIFIDKYYLKQKPLHHFLLSLGLKVHHALERKKLN